MLLNLVPETQSGVLVKNTINRMKFILLQVKFIIHRLVYGLYVWSYLHCFTYVNNKYIFILGTMMKEPFILHNCIIIII